MLNLKETFKLPEMIDEGQKIFGKKMEINSSATRNLENHTLR